VTREPDDRTIADAIDALLGERRNGASICPSEVARRLSPEDWRPLMPTVREVALRMAQAGRIRITRRGDAVDPWSCLKGPIRLRRASASEAL
jgi:hypothetical protein